MTQSCGVEFRRKLPERSFPHAEPGEDALHDVLPGGTSGELSQGVEPVFDVRHHGVGGQSGGEGLPRPADGFQRPADGVLLADVRQVPLRLRPLQFVQNAGQRPGLVGSFMRASKYP